MYDRYDDPWFPSSHPSAYPSAQPHNDLVTHLVFVGGRLAESWSEEAADSRYAEFARSLATERRQVMAPLEPAPPAHVQLLEWLDEQAGSRASLIALTGEPLTDGGIAVPEADRSADRQRLQAITELLDDCTSELLRVPEWGNACRRALAMLWESDREVITQAPSASHVAAAIVWAIGKANGWFPTSGHSICTQSTLRDHFGLSTYAGSYGKSVQAALQAVWPTPGHSSAWGRPATPDLVSLGRPALLTASTRRTLIRLRDQALASERIATGGEFDQAG